MTTFHCQRESQREVFLLRLLKVHQQQRCIVCCLTQKYAHAVRRLFCAESVVVCTYSTLVQLRIAVDFVIFYQLCPTTMEVAAEHQVHLLLHNKDVSICQKLSSVKQWKNTWLFLLSESLRFHTRDQPPLLADELLWRKALVTLSEKLERSTGYPAAEIFPISMVERISVYQPTSIEGLQQIAGIGTGWLERWGTITLQEIDRVRHHENRASDNTRVSLPPK